ncbi:hypothetical protein [Burkholderia metallica]
MKLTTTAIQRALFRDLFDLTADEISRIAIGTPVRVCLQARRNGSARSLSWPQQGVPVTPCADRTVLHILD